jgi:hypothetical protein
MPESHSYYDQRQPRDRSLRAGDGDRDAIADLLREQHLAGRLSTDEFQERLDRCFAATTYRELDELLADLPAGEPVRSVRRPWRFPALAVLPFLIAAIVLSHGHVLWFVVPMFFWFVYRPWHRGPRGDRFGWGFSGCGVRRSPPPGSYV